MTFIAAGEFRSSKRSSIRTAAASMTSMPLPMTRRWLSLRPSSMNSAPPEPEIDVQRRELDVLMCNVLRAGCHLEHRENRAGTSLAVAHDLLNHFLSVCGLK